MDWELVKNILAEIVAYFKKVFEFFGYLPKEEATPEEEIQG